MDVVVDVVSFGLLLSALAARTISSVSRVGPPLTGMPPVSCSASSTARGTAAPSPCSVMEGRRSSMSRRCARRSSTLRCRLVVMYMSCC